MAVPPGSVDEAVAGIRALGFAGANVTMPHKEEVARSLDDLSEDARRVNAVNTIVLRPSGAEGHNTDVPGFERFLREDAGFEPEGRTALVFGAGGAARACALALARGGISRVVVAARDLGRARTLARTVEDLTPIDVTPWEGAAMVETDLVVNATPVGVDGEALPIPELAGTMVVVDLLYRPATTPLLARAKHAGVAAFGGFGLLLRQAALSFELWTGQAPPLDVMSAAAVTSVAEIASDAEVDPALGAPDRPTT
jgi:shikimate dehydrogenase